MEMVAIEIRALKKRRECFSRAFAWEAGMPEDDSDSLALAGEEDPLSEQAVDLRGSLDDETGERRISH